MNSRQAKKQATKVNVAEVVTIVTPEIKDEKDTVVKAEVTESKEKKSTAKKTVEKKETAAKKTAEKKELVPEIFIQYENHEAELEHVVDAAKQAYVESGHRVSSIKDLKIYLKPEDSAAYYVINGKVAGKVELF